MRSLRGSQGLTLLEVLFTALLLLAGIGGALLLYTNAMVTSGFSAEMTVAASHAENVLEEMQSKFSLADVTGMDWEKWFQESGLPTLPQETLRVRFTNPNADPLDIQATITWQQKSRTNTVSLQTQMTK